MTAHIGRWLVVLAICTVIMIGGIMPRFDFDNQTGAAFTVSIEAQAASWCATHTNHLHTGVWNFVIWQHWHFHDEPVLWCSTH